MSKLVTITVDYLSLSLLVPERGMSDILGFGSLAEEEEVVIRRGNRIIGVVVMLM